MGWSSGSGLFIEVIEKIEEQFAGAVQLADLYDELISAFEDRDCDTLDEAEGVSADLDAALLRAGYISEE